MQNAACPCTKACACNGLVDEFLAKDLCFGLALEWLLRGFELQQDSD